MASEVNGHLSGYPVRTPIRPSSGQVGHPGHPYIEGVRVSAGMGER